MYDSWTVNQIIGQGFPYSLDLGIRAILFGTIGGVALGIAAALKRGKFVDFFSILVAVTGACVPSFVVASFTQYIFAYALCKPNLKDVQLGFQSPSPDFVYAYYE